MHKNASINIQREIGSIKAFFLKKKSNLIILSKYAPSLNSSC